MTLPLTTDTLEAAYELLKTTPPFCKWNLPDGEDIKFVVAKTRECYAQYLWDGRQHIITVSAGKVGQFHTLLESMSHELVHLHLELTGMESRNGTPYTHNLAFRALALQVCRIHGFDLKAFY